MSLLQWTSEDGKYHVEFNEGRLRAYRYGEFWRELTGDGLILAMLSELADERRCVASGEGL